MNYHLSGQFPKLHHSDYRETSPLDPVYNCIAWAAGDVNRWWWPIRFARAVYWPRGVPMQEDLPSFVAAFQILGFSPCQNGDLEAGFEKIALFASADGTPTHAARQLNSGCWSSKLGEGHDIEHVSLIVLEGGIYGEVVQFLKRPFT